MLSGNGWVFNRKEGGLLARVVAAEMGEVNKQAWKKTNLNKKLGQG